VNFPARIVEDERVTRGIGGKFISKSKLEEEPSKKKGFWERLKA